MTNDEAYVYIHAIPMSDLDEICVDSATSSCWVPKRVLMEGSERDNSDLLAFLAGYTNGKSIKCDFPPADARLPFSMYSLGDPNYRRLNEIEEYVFMRKADAAQRVVLNDEDKEKEGG